MPSSASTSAPAPPCSTPRSCRWPRATSTTCAAPHGAARTPLHLLHSAGGMMSVEAAKARPLSDGDVRSRRRAWPRPPTSRAALGLARALAFDMGGTTTDVCLIADGVPGDGGRSASSATIRCGCPWWPWSRSGRAAARSPASTRPAPSRSGRGARARCPGPACYGLGGTEPTVSDANLILGYLNPERIYGGSIRLDRARAGAGARAARASASACPCSRRPTAWSKWPTRTCCARSGWSPCSAATICASSRSSPTAAPGRCTRARSRAPAGIARVVVPAHSGAFSALGCLVSPLRYDAVQTHRARLEAWDAKVVEDRFRALEAQCLPPARSTKATIGRACSRAAERRPPLRRPELRARGRTAVAGDPGRAAGGLRGAAPPALRLRHRRERRVREPAGDRPRRRGAAAASAPAAGASALSHRLAPRLLPGDGRASRCRAMTARALPPGHVVAGPAHGRRRVVHDASSIPASAASRIAWATSSSRWEAAHERSAESRDSGSRPQRALRHRRGDERHRHALGALAPPQGGGRSLLRADRRARGGSSPRAATSPSTWA